jgi:HEPN domain-containing protein
MAELSKQKLIQLADEKLRDAKLLLDAGSPSNAYYLAGYAIELVFKAILVSRIRAETLPSPEFVKDIFTHDFGRLLGLADLKAELAAKRDADPDFSGRWQIILEWRETSRYDVHERGDAERLIEAIEHAQHGVLQWLRAKL